MAPGPRLIFPGAALHHWPGPRGWRATAGRALGGGIASPLVLEPDLSCRDMWGGLGGAETTRGRRLVLNTQGCPGNASPKPKSGLSPVPSATTNCGLGNVAVYTRGGRKNKTRKRRTFAPARKKKYARTFFFFFFPSAFLGVSRQGEFENTRKKLSTFQKKITGEIFFRGKFFLGEFF